MIIIIMIIIWVFFPSDAAELQKQQCEIQYVNITMKNVQTAKNYHYYYYRVRSVSVLAGTEPVYAKAETCCYYCRCQGKVVEPWNKTNLLVAIIIIIVTIVIIIMLAAPMSRILKTLSK